ncbi:MAG: Gfo/Idh/MocA family oxidoreductase [Planctomycetes bacterium]|nr:Gfo/Idh/MocA family oxidoreductase [Planctomycetota bacterium]
MKTTRREFFDQLLAAATVGASTFSGRQLFGQAAQPTAPRSPNETVRVGVVGVRGRGRAHIGEFKKMANVEVTAICDADSAMSDLALKSVPEAKYFQDVRHMLESDLVDVVTVATPNHWHSLVSIWALQAGKHVYVEKPLSHDVFEGRQLVRAADASGLVVQHGTQSRTATATRDAMAYLHSGALGKVKFARALCYKRRQSIGKVAGPQTPPDSCDYKLWCGPAGVHELRRKSLHYDWHWNFRTGNGDMGNQGVHQMDIARWGLGVDHLPQRIMSVGGRFGYVDDGDTPNTLLSLFDYGEQQLMFEVRGLKTPGYRGASIGVVFECEKGYLVSASYGKLHAYDHDGNVIQTFEGDQNHFAQFMQAVRAGKPEMVNASPLEGHLSSALCHLGNISYLAGESTPVKKMENAFAKFKNGPGVEIAAESLSRYYKHLGENGLDLSKELGFAGSLLNFDAKTERFTGAHADAANKLLRKPVAEGFEVPSLG